MDGIRTSDTGGGEKYYNVRKADMLNSGHQGEWMGSLDPDNCACTP